MIIHYRGPDREPACNLRSKRMSPHLWEVTCMRCLGMFRRPPWAGAQRAFYRTSL